MSEPETHAFLYIHSIHKEPIDPRSARPLHARSAYASMRHGHPCLLEAAITAVGAHGLVSVVSEAGRMPQPTPHNPLRNIAILSGNRVPEKTTMNINLTYDEHFLTHIR